MLRHPLTSYSDCLQGVEGVKDSQTTSPVSSTPQTAPQAEQAVVAPAPVPANQALMAMGPAAVDEAAVPQTKLSHVLGEDARACPSPTELYELNSTWVSPRGVVVGVSSTAWLAIHGMYMPVSFTHVQTNMQCTQPLRLPEPVLLWQPIAKLCHCGQVAA